MIKFRDNKSAKAKAVKNVVVEVKHPRKLNKANSIWGDIDLGKHSKDVSHLLSGAPDPNQDSVLRVQPSLVFEPPVPPVARVLEDKKRAAEIEAEKQALLAIDPDAEPTEEEMMVPPIQDAEIVAEAEESGRVEASSAEVVASETVVAETETATEAGEEVVSNDIVAELAGEHIEEVTVNEVVEDEVVEAATTEQVTAAVEPEVVSEAEVEASVAAEPEAEVVEAQVSEEPTLEALETNETEGSDEEIEASLSSDDDEDEVFDEPQAAVKAAIVRPNPVAPRMVAKRIPGVRYVRRNGELQIARGEKWKMKRTARAAR